MSRCPSCNFDNPPAMKFCGECGHALARRAAPEAERRQLTVMFCDLVGSTALANRLDPEELRDLIRAYQRAAGEGIAKFDGTIAQHLGDGLLVYFGYPIAHEDDALRAVHGALAVLERIAALNDRLPEDRRLAVRVGIHTGPVVAGDIGSGTRERLALGPTPNIAARLQERAQANTVLISRQTFDLVTRAFACEPLGACTLKGFPEPVDTYRLIGRTQDATARRHPMVGRDAELAGLRATFDEVSAGHGRAVAIVAEAGLGKSRLVRSFERHVADRGAGWYETSCSPYEQATALRPVAMLIERVIGIDAQPSTEERTTAVIAALTGAGIDAAEGVPLIAALLSMPLPPAFTPSALPPPQQRVRTFEIVIGLLTGRTSSGPHVVLFEDLHWADHSTIEFLRLLIQRGADVPLLALFTSRPTDAASFDPRVERVALPPLGRDAVADIALEMAGGRPLPPRVIDQIVDKTDGVPLFVEELTKTILESGALRDVGGRFELTGDAGALTIPMSLQASLMARLDRLAAAKDVAQLASVIGREFSFELLSAMAARPDEALAHDLSRLVDAELIDQIAAPPHATYLFKHALVRDAAYDMLLKSTRRQHHGRLAAALVDRFPDVARSRPELVAQHLTEAGELEGAVEYWLRAGQAAMQQSANVEAEGHLQRGLDLLERLPASDERDHSELAYLTSLGSVLVFTHGFTAPDVERTYLRAIAVNGRVGDLAKGFWIKIGLWTFHMVCGKVPESSRVAEETLSEARTGRDSLFLARAAMVASWSQYFSGNFAACADRTQIALDNFHGPDPEFQRHIGTPPISTSEVIRALALWHLGELSASDQCIERALALNAEERHAYSVAVVLVRVVESHHFRRDAAMVRRYATQLADLCDRHGFPAWRWNASLWLAWADAVAPDSATGAGDAIDPVAVLDGVTTMGASLAVGYFCTLSAETLRRRGRPDDARALLDRAVALVESTGDRMWAADTYRSQAELMLETADRHTPELIAAARDLLQRAIDTARSQGSRSLEQRALHDVEQLAAIDSRVSIS